MLRLPISPMFVNGCPRKQVRGKIYVRPLLFCCFIAHILPQLEKNTGLQVYIIFFLLFVFRFSFSGTTKYFLPRCVLTYRRF